MKKLLISIMLVLTVFACTGVFAETVDDKITVYVDGNEIQFDVQPMIKEGRTLIPLRGVFEALGAEVKWYQESQSIYVRKGLIGISLSIGANEMYGPKGTIELDVAPELVDNRTLIPLRAVSEALEAKVTWINETREIYINSKQGTFEYETEKLSELVKGRHVTYDISLEYPVFKNAEYSEALTKINNELKEIFDGEFEYAKGDASQIIEDADSAYEEFIQENPDSEDYWFPTEYEDETRYGVMCNTSKYVSILFENYSYLGGAHGGTYMTCFTYDMETGDRVKAEDVLGMTTEELRAYIREETKKFVAENPDIEEGLFDDIDTYFETTYDFDEDYDPYDAIFWYLDGRNIVFGYQLYSIGPYAMGIIEVPVELKPQTVIGTVVDAAMHSIIIETAEGDKIAISRYTRDDEQIPAEFIGGLTIGDKLSVDFICGEPVKIKEIA